MSNNMIYEERRALMLGMMRASVHQSRKGTGRHIMYRRRPGRMVHTEGGLYRGGRMTSCSLQTSSRPRHDSLDKSTLGCKA